MGYGVIGSPTVSGSVSLGSSPGTPARPGSQSGILKVQSRPPSSSGLGRRPLTAVAAGWIPPGGGQKRPPVYHGGGRAPPPPPPAPAPWGPPGAGRPPGGPGQNPQADPGALS